MLTVGQTDSEVFGPECLYVSAHADVREGGDGWAAAVLHAVLGDRAASAAALLQLPWAPRPPRSGALCASLAALGLLQRWTAADPHLLPGPLPAARDDCQSAIATSLCRCL